MLGSKDQKADLMLRSGPELFRAIIARDLGIVLADVDDGSRVGSRSVVITRLFQSDAKIPQLEVGEINQIQTIDSNIQTDILV